MFGVCFNLAAAAAPLVASGADAAGPFSGLAELIVLASPGLLVLCAAIYRARPAIARLEQGRSPGLYGGISLGVLLSIGVALLAFALGPSRRDAHALLLAIVLLAATIFAASVVPLRVLAAQIVGKIDALTDRQQFWTAVAIVPIVAVYLPAMAVLIGRDLRPSIHDEFSYALMARIYASGHLWMPAHPLADAFESFYMYTTPVYGSMYFPGAGLLYAVVLRLGLPLWVGAAVIAGAFAGMLFRLLARVLSPARGLASVVALLGVAHFRWFATHALSHVPLAVAVMLAYWAHLRWRERGTLRWLVAFATASGFAAITRPYDAILLLLPPGIDIIVRLVRAGPHVAVRGGVLMALCLSPYLMLQVSIDHAFTGHWLQTPHSLYVEKNMPHGDFGFYPADPAIRPETTLRQKVDFYDGAITFQLNAHALANVKSLSFWAERLVFAFSTMFAFPLLLLVVPIGFAAALRPRLWPFATAAALFFLGYVPYPFFISWYTTSVLFTLFVFLWAAIPPLNRLMGLGPGVIDNALILATVVTSLAAQPFWWGKQGYQVGFSEAGELRMIDQFLADDAKPPALVFFVYGGNRDESSQQEPVYNLDTAWPDDAPVIRVHSRSVADDVKVLAYYQKQNGRRQVYVYDRYARTLRSFGTIDAFLHKLSAGPATRAATQPH